ncbi:helix-turn-helix domain-containing protein [Nocardia sp. NPDC127579]|uniref:helix-turn-helix domain-containing protein n=1 Tax=Nocardia sp. NPDC127579 TaxID=3345402 RepID=UPI003631E705
MYEAVDLNTSSVGETDRVDYWTEHCQINQGAMRFDFGNWREFTGTMRVHRGGGFQLVDYTAGATEYSRTRRQAMCEGNPTARIIVPLGGDVGIGHGDNTVQVPAGQLGLIDWRRPVRVSSRADTRMWVAHIPEQYVPTRELDAGAPLTLSPNRGAVAAVLALLGAVADHAGTLSGPEFTAINSRMLELLTISLHESGAREQSRFAALAHAARRHIGEHSDDRRLTAESVASHLGCSRRQLEYALRAAGFPSPARLIATTRADRAHRRLLDPCERRSIADIAFASGFDSLNTFNRTFRDHFRESPTQTRDRYRTPRWIETVP